MKYAALDIESVGTDLKNPIVWILSLVYGNKKWLIQDPFGIRKLPKEVIKILEDPNICKVIHNAAFDGTYLKMALGVNICNVWCTQSAETIINSYAPRGKKKRKDHKVIYRNEEEEQLYATYGVSLDLVQVRYGFKPSDKTVTANFINRPKGLAFTKKELDYAQDDTKDLIKIQRLQQYLLERDGQLEVALLENETAEAIIRMRAHGIKMDSSIQKRIAYANEAEYKRRLAKLPKEVANWGSEKQVKAYFHTKGIHIDSYKNLEIILKQTKNKTLEDFMAAMELKKAVTAYGLNMLEFINPNTGLIHCDVFQIKETGRMSMGNPNLQQIPRKGNFREAYVAQQGNAFGISDFSGQEIGIMAAMADEKLWIDAMLRGDDVHSLTASMLYERDWDQGYIKGCTFPKKCSCPIHMDRREKTKTLNFMLAYGGGPQKFSFITGISMFDAKLIIKRYKKIIPNITKTLEDNAKLAVNTGECFSADPYKRRRLLIGSETWHMENQGKNSPIQAAGANMLKLAMISMPKNIPIALVIHDEIITEQPRKIALKNILVQKQVMEKTADYITGIKGLIKVDPKIALDISKNVKCDKITYKGVKIDIDKRLKL